MRLFSSNERAEVPVAPDGVPQRITTLVLVGAESGDTVAPEDETAEGAYNLGTVAQAVGDEAEAAWHYGRALVLDPGMTPAMFNMAVMVAGSEPGRAVVLYRRIVAAQPSASTAFFNLGLLLIEQASTRTEGLTDLALAIHLDGALASRVPKGVNVPLYPVGTLPAPTTSVDR